MKQQFPTINLQLYLKSSPCHSRFAGGKPYLGPEITQALIKHGRSDQAALEQKRPSLSDRELQVLTLMATPNTYKQIGEQLYIGEETVRIYVKRIMIKLDEPKKTPFPVLPRSSTYLKISFS